MIDNVQLNILSRESDIDKNTIIEIFRNEVCDYYQAFHTIFYSDNTIELFFTSESPCEITTKKIFISKKKFVLIIKKTSIKIQEIIYKNTKQINLERLKNKIFKARINQNNEVEIYENRILVPNVRGKLFVKDISKLKNKIFDCRFDPKSLRYTKEQKIVGNCFIIIKKKGA